MKIKRKESIFNLLYKYTHIDIKNQDSIDNLIQEIFNHQQRFYKEIYSEFEKTYKPYISSLKKKITGSTVYIRTSTSAENYNDWKKHHPGRFPSVPWHLSDIDEKFLLNYFINVFLDFNSMKSIILSNINHFSLTLFLQIIDNETANSGKIRIEKSKDNRIYYIELSGRNGITIPKDALLFLSEITEKINITYSGYGKRAIFYNSSGFELDFRDSYLYRNEFDIINKNWKKIEINENGEIKLQDYFQFTNHDNSLDVYKSEVIEIDNKMISDIIVRSLNKDLDFCRIEFYEIDNTINILQIDI